MDVEFICFIIAGKFQMQKTGISACTVDEGGYCGYGTGKKDLAVNIGDGSGIHRNALLLPV